jgi:hypothetical protein
MVKVCFTADKYTPESLELGTPAESGYVNLDWNRFQIMEPGDEWTKPFDTIAEAKQFIEDSIGETEASNDSYYGIDSVMDSDGNTWSFAGHIDD